MNCLICKKTTKFYFTKQFNKFGLKNVDYWKCGSCGFTAAKTLYELNDQKWTALNEEFHSSYHFTDECYFDKNWIKRLKIQAKTLALLKNKGLLTQKKPWLDYGCGDGKLSQFLTKNKVTLLNYDEYPGTHTTNILPLQNLHSHGFDLVVSTSVFEHIRNLETLNKIEHLVSQNGCLAIHTLVREEIPQDPNWFYLLPVHCSLFSNKSMQILFEKWKYEFSLYHVPSRMWFWYRKKPENLEKIITNLNKDHKEKEYFYKSGFMDYWK